MEGLDGGRLYTCVQMLPFPEGPLFCFISSRARKWAVNQSVVNVDGQLTSTGGDDGEEIERERKYDGFARKIQKAWRRQFFFQLKQKGLKLIFLLVFLWARITGVFCCIGLISVGYVTVGKRERIDFSQTVTKYDRRFKVSLHQHSSKIHVYMYMYKSFVIV